MSQPELRPATRADVLEAFRNLYGCEKEIPCRIVAFTGRVDGRVIAVGGVAMWPNGVRVAFCDISEEGRRFPLSLHRGARMALERARKVGIREAIVVDESDVHPKTPNWLRHLGFEPIEQGGARGWKWKANSHADAGSSRGNRSVAGGSGNLGGGRERAGEE